MALPLTSSSTMSSWLVGGPILAANSSGVVLSRVKPANWSSERKNFLNGARLLNLTSYSMFSSLEVLPYLFSAIARKNTLPPGRRMGSPVYSGESTVGRVPSMV